MAALLLRRSLQRREFASISSFASLAGKSQHSPLLGSKFSSLIRPFSSRPAGNDVIGIDLGTTNSCVAVMEGKRISTSRQLLANSDATPIPSPLTPLLGPSTGNAETQAAVSKPDKVQAVLKGIKQSPKKLNLVAAVVRGMRVEDALLQMQVTVKRAAKTVYQVIHSARANATHNHSLDPDRLVVAEAYVGKGLNKKRVSFHAKGRSGIMIRPVSRVTVVVREMTPEEEAQLARLRVHNFKKLSKKEHRLVPHQLIESNPIWGRKNSKARSTRSETLD